MNAEPRRRWLTAAGIALALLLIGSVLGWAATTVLLPSPSVLQDEPFGTVAVDDGVVESSLSLNVAASWTSRPAALNRASGTVTTVDVRPGGEVHQGTRLYTVNLRPVVAGQGAVPAFGPIQRGDQGPHVAQLQAFLAAQGLYSGQVDGTFGALTAAAVRAWQKAAGYPVDGVVQAADIVWLPALPTRVILDAERLTVGEEASPGGGDIFALASAPDFVIPMTPAQAAQAAVGTPVSIEGPEGTEWTAVVAEQVADENAEETINARLASVDEQPICRDRCSLIAPTGRTILAAEVITVPSKAGLVVPAAAIRTDSSGRTYVTTPEGDRVAITVVQTARGMSLIEGVERGLVVRIPAA